MGTPKGLLRDERAVPYLDRVLGTLFEGGCETVTVVLGASAPEVAALLAEVAADVRPQCLWTALSAMAEADLRDVLARIAVPTLLIWGALDGRSPLSVARQFEQAIDGARLVVIPDAGHVSNLERPEAFNEAVRAFCREHRA
jgi:pimeloyl-ACP methyl ester carboxylesterase